METEMYDTWILDGMELNICVRALGYSEWHYIPVENTGENLKEKMLESFLRLVDKEMFYATDGGFLPTEQMKALILPIADPDEIFEANEQGKYTVFFGKDEGNLVGVEKIETEKESYRIFMALKKDYYEWTDKIVESETGTRPKRYHIFEN